MAKKPPLSPEEVTELFSELDSSGVVDPKRARERTRRVQRLRDAKAAGATDGMARLADDDRKSAPARVVDPLSQEDPSGSKVGNAISFAAKAFVAAVLLLVVGMQIGYGVGRRLNTANLSEAVNRSTVSSALEGGVEWGNGFTQFPSKFTVDEADETTGRLEVTVVDTSSKNELELLSNSQIQAAALATNALLNDKINIVVYNVQAVVDRKGNLVCDTFFGMIPAEGTRRAILTFVWTKSTSDTSRNIDWELRIIGMDDKIASRIQKQVNSVSSLIENPLITQEDIERQYTEQRLEQMLKGSEIFLGGECEKTPEDALAAVGQ